MKSFHSGVIAPKTPNSEGVKQAPHSEQAKGCTTERYCLLRVVVQGPGSFQGPVNFSVQRTVAELRGIKVAQFSYFGLFSPYKTPKKVPSGDEPTAQGLHRRMIPIFPCGSRRSNEVPAGSGVFLRLLVGELWTPKLAQIFAYGKWLYPYRMLLHGASDLNQRCLKKRSSKDEKMYFATKYLRPYPQNPILGMQNLLQRQLSVSRTLIELRS